jgi:hypothetical protein
MRDGRKKEISFIEPNKPKISNDSFNFLSKVSSISLVILNAKQKKTFFNLSDINNFKSHIDIYCVKLFFYFKFYNAPRSV